MTDFNSPDLRQTVLKDRLAQGAPLIAKQLAEEMGISTDTIRRDLIALEKNGLVRRVRGGALPTRPPAPSYLERVEHPDENLDTLAFAAVSLLERANTVFIDGGTTMNALAARIPAGYEGHVITPAPAVALAALARGARVQLIGGMLCAEGAMSTGGAAEQTVSRIAADLCLLGACGLCPVFGLSTEDPAESGVKRAMALAASRVVVVTSASKLARKGRHMTLYPSEIDSVVIRADPADLGDFKKAGIGVIHV